MKKTICVLCGVLLLSVTLVGCAKRIERAPEDFSFSLTWSVFGISSYDSATGRLVKTSDEHIETEYRLTEQERQQIWEWICELKPERYPNEYDPNPDVGCDPVEILILTVRTPEGEKTITARDVAFADTASNAKGDRFLKTCRAIQRLLTDTDAWQAMPDGELGYA